MTTIDWGLTAKAIIWIILGCAGFWLYILFASWVGQKLHALSAEYPTTSEHDQWVAENEAAHQEWLREQEVLRLKRVLAIAEEVVAAPEHERQRLYREAEALGFLDQDDEPKRRAS